MKKLILLVSILTFNSSIALSEDIPSDSLFHLSSMWINQENEEVTLKELGGKPTLFSLVYLSCSFTCPAVVTELQNIVSKLDSSEKRKVQVVLFSFDPEKDTPKAMKAFVKKRKLDAKQWSFYTNKDEKRIRELATVLNFKYAKEKNGEFTHSYLIGVLDNQGVLTARVDGMNKDPKKLLKAIRNSIKSMNL